MRNKIFGLLVCLLLLSSFLLGCFDDSGDSKPNKAPEADIGPNLEANTLTDIQFSTENCTDPDGKIASYLWDFGDFRNPGDETSTEPNPTYNYSRPGVFKVTLTITDNDGSEAVDTLKVTVLNRPPVVDVGGPISAKIYDIIHFDAIAIDLDGYVTDYEWDFDGDGNYDWFASTTGSTTHFYIEPGVYDATLTVTDDRDEQAKAIKKVTITEEPKIPPIADAGLNQSIPTGEVMLKGSGFDADGSIELYEWDFDGDGEYDWSHSSSGIVKYTYSTEGEFKAKLRVSDDDGLWDIDIVTINVNNSFIAQQVSAQVYINWTDSYEYIIILNDSINSSNLKITITDIVTNMFEEFSPESITELTNRSYTLTSTLVPRTSHSIHVEVFYYGKLIGARAIDLVNQSYEYIGPEFDFLALYDTNQIIEERDNNEIEILRMTSIGELEFKHRGDLFYTSLKGTGVYYILDTFDGGQTETVINCTTLWINVTVQGSEIISKSITLDGHGTIEIDYEETLTLDMDVLTIRLIRENNIDIENYIYAEGTFSGSVEDPNTMTTMNMAGDVYFTSELLGTAYKNNWDGEEYFCSIMWMNVTLDGESWVTGSPFKTPIFSTQINTTWNADFEKYTNNSIYFEYSSFTTVANLDYYDEGSGYPEGYPTPRKATLHINDALSFDTPRPRVMVGEDSILLSSTHEVTLLLSVTDELEETIDGKKYSTVWVHGKYVQGAVGYLDVRMISSGSYTGLPVYDKMDVTWRNEWAKRESTLKSIS